MTEQKFVFHNCKNKKCNNGWNDVDLTNVKSRPPKWKYCDECCEKYGFVNPPYPPKKQLSEKQKEVIEKNKFQKRKKDEISNETKEGDKE